ncbi:MAG: FAD-dependent monooxygenase [Pseudomonadota bacterium]|jgi:kynurenine 3-monooxygenase|nr:FAD-dependent monooxygenase [Pseudomonadota bacterium]QKK04633.1 MAG: FAD-dependent monooxygenase [Pseudomonadota bacterium]
MNETKKETLHVIGGGLVGPLTAIYLARRGFDVKLYERRGDMRRGDADAGRSINLALTARGLKALERVGLKEEIMKITIPMTGRMVHDRAGKTELQPYGQKEDEVIYAASRGLLNIMLLDAAESYENITILFHQRCLECDVENGSAVFEDINSGAKTEISGGPIIAADGAWSAVRKSMLENVPNYNYAQSFLDYGYKELEIPPAENGGFLMEKNALHIWPRNAYMLIALPNTDGSFTCTLFYPYKGENSFAHLQTPEDVTAFFKRDFADALELMPTLTDDFFDNPTGALATIKCSPWHDGGKCCLIGDAAHAIVPFFAQGMNSGFEDCVVLDDILEAAGGTPDWADVFARLETSRKPNTDAIADMAVENFTEMRDSVTDPHFLLKKEAGFALEKRYPGKFIPRYSMVIFHPEIPYAEARRRSIEQDAMLEELCRDIQTAEQIDWNKADALMQELSIAA